MAGCDSLRCEKFSNLGDRCRYIALLFCIQLRLQETKEELDEFQEGSRELEAELEAQLEQAEARQRELLSNKTRLETDNENLKVHLYPSCYICSS